MGATGATGSQGPAGAAGPAGAQGATGATGPTGPTSTQIVVGAAAPTGGNNNAIGTLTGVSTATCPAGKVLLGGGALAANASSGTGVAAVFSSRPASGSSTTAWEATAVVTRAETAGGHISVTAYAVCTA
jgi:hypothetical protein